MDLSLDKVRDRTVFLRFIYGLTSAHVTLDGSVVRRGRIVRSHQDLDALTSVRVIGDTTAGVVLQGTTGEPHGSFVLPLLRKANSFGIYTLSADAFEALARAIAIVDVRDTAETAGLWPTRGAGGHIQRAVKAAHLVNAGVEGRAAVAELLREQSLYMRDRADLATSPLAAHLLTSSLIAASMAMPFQELPGSVEG